MEPLIGRAIFFFILAAALVSAGFTPPGGGVVGSKHDMNTFPGIRDPEERVCVFCHTPHHAVSSAQSEYLPLWSHQVTGVTNFQPYRSATVPDSDITDPMRGPTKLCMSCHDGVIALDSYYGGVGSQRMTGDSFGQKATGAGGDLRNDHPVGFDYIAVSERRHGIRPASTPFIGGTVTIADALFEGRFMTCATCHDVHNKDNKSGNPALYNFFLYAREENSEICLSCHDK